MNPRQEPSAANEIVIGDRFKWRVTCPVMRRSYWRFVWIGGRETSAYV